jgi:urease accessory protein
MREIVELVTDSTPGEVVGSLTLPFHERRKSRQRVRLDSGEEAALVLPRGGAMLRDGDRLRCGDGSLIAVRAALETLSRALTSDPLTLARAAYHLGNRHIPIAIDEGGLSYQHDHVLDDMVRSLGLPVTTIEAPFNPEPGAYAQGTHGHDHGHDHDHDHDHDH